MSAPDHRPYLREGDLRTAGDVHAWLNETMCDDDFASEVMRELKQRLDRERRQACRRAARARFAGLAWYGRLVRAGHEWDLDDPKFASECAWDDAADALAFRAAARTP